MRKFGSTISGNNGMKMNPDENNDEKIDVLSRTRTTYDEEDEKVSSKSLVSDGSETAYNQDQQMMDGKQVTGLRNPDTRGQSLLSPLNENNQGSNNLPEEISPFSTRFSDRKKEFEDADMEIEEAISTNRLQFYALFIVIAYVISLGIGYHYTSFEDGVPRVVTLEERNEREYLGNANEYVTVLQELHAESFDNVEQYTLGNIAFSELKSKIDKNNEKLNKMNEEMDDLSIPPRFESLHSELKMLYSAQLGFNTGILTYGKTKSEDDFDVLSDLNTNYEDKMMDYLSEFEMLLR